MDPTTEQLNNRKLASEGSPYTFNKTGSGNIEVFQNGSRISTGTADSARSYGYLSPEELQIKDNQEKAKALSASLGASSPSSTPYVSNSSSVVTKENNTMTALQNLMGQTGDIKSLIDNFSNSLNDVNAYSSALDMRRTAQEKTIMEQYGIAKQDTQNAQEKESGSTNVALTRLGGYLGGSGSQVGVLNNLATTHRMELAKLDTQRDAALQAARSAIEDKQFALAQLKVEEVKSITSTIYQRNQDFFNNAIKLSQEGRAQDDQTAQNVTNLLKGISDVAASGIDVAIDPEKAQLIDSYYGAPGFTAAYADAKNSAAKAETEKEQIAATQSFINLIQDIPAGMEVPVGDKMVKGIGNSSDLFTFQVTGSDGETHVINYNKRSGTYTDSPVGYFKTESGGGSLSILDVQRYNDLYPNAGVQAGDSELIANQKVTASNSPEAKLRGTIMQLQTSGDSYNDTVNNINSSKTITDKATALKIAKEVYNVGETPESPIENEIAQMQKSKILNNSDIRNALRSRYTQQEINNSSVGNALESVITGIGNIFGLH